MKWLGRILRLLFGLLWRLVVLLLFEKWVPFPEQEQVAPAAPRAASKKAPARVDAREQDDAAQRAGAPGRVARVKPLPFFAQELGSRAASAPARGKRENLGALLRDRRALRAAVVLDAALGVRYRTR